MSAIVRIVQRGDTPTRIRAALDEADRIRKKYNLFQACEQRSIRPVFDRAEEREGKK